MKNVRRSRLRKVKIYQLASNKRILGKAGKLAMREKKKKDKLITNENCLLVVFRPENVATLPKADCAI